MMVLQERSWDTRVIITDLQQWRVSVVCGDVEKIVSALLLKKEKHTKGHY